MSYLVGIHHVGLRVADLDEAVDRWSAQFGFTLRERHGDRAYLRCAFEDYGLELIQSGDPGFDHAGWELRPGVSLGDVTLEGERPPGRSVRSPSSATSRSATPGRSSQPAWS